MEVFLAILGLGMLYSWGHLIYLNVMKLKDLSNYETFIVVFGWITFILYVIGTLTD